MKQREKCSGPGFDAGRSTINTLESRPVLISDFNSHNRLRVQCVFDGPELVSTGQRVTEWTAHQQRCKKKKPK